MPGVSGVDFLEEERCGQGGQPSTTTVGANSISDISMNAQDGPTIKTKTPEISTLHVWSPTKEFL